MSTFRFAVSQRAEHEGEQLAEPRGDARRDAHPLIGERAQRREVAYRDPVLLGCLVVVLLPFAVAMVRVLFVHWTPMGDWALLELRTRSVGSTHTPLVGPYSRFGWSHPGPALFFALAIPYRLVGSHANGLLFAALVVNAASVAAIVLLAWRRGRRPLTLATAIGLALLCRSVGADFLRDPWNPYITVLPFAALIFLAWSIVCGDVWMLPVAVFVASFIVQSHVGYAALVVAVLGVAMVWRVVDLVRRRHDATIGASRRRSWAVLTATVAVTIVAWLPPLIDQTRNGGNLQAIWKFFGKPHTTPTTSTALRLVGKALAFPGAWFTGGETVNTSKLLIPAVSGFFVPVGLVALALCALAAMRRRDHDASALPVLLIAALLAAVYSVTNIAGPLAAYLVRWLLVLGMVTWLASVWAIWPSLRRMRLARGARIALVVVASAALVLPTAASVDDALRDRAPWYRAGLVEQRLARDTIAHLRSESQPVVLESKGDHWWTWGLAPRLEAAGITVAARPEDTLYYGGHRVARGRAARVAVVVVVGPDAGAAGPKGGRLLAFYQGRAQPSVLVNETADYATVIRAAEDSLLANTVAVYEVPL